MLSSNVLQYEKSGCPANGTVPPLGKLPYKFKFYLNSFFSSTYLIWHFEQYLIHIDCVSFVAFRCTKMYIKLPFFTKFYDIVYILYYNSLSFTTCDIHVEDICLVKSGFELFIALNTLISKCPLKCKHSEYWNKLKSKLECNLYIHCNRFRSWCGLLIW